MKAWDLSGASLRAAGCAFWMGWLSVPVGAQELLSPDSLQPYQVIASQQGAGHVELRGHCPSSGAVEARVLSREAPLPHLDWKAIGAGSGSAAQWTGGLGPIPVGGEYLVQIRCLSPQGEQTAIQSVPGILVGDLWIVSGQSNAVGLGREPGPPAIAQVHSISYIEEDQLREGRAQRAKEGLIPAQEQEASHPLGRWRRAEDPLGPFFTGPWVFAAQRYYARTGVPVGLIWYASGGKTIEYFKQGTGSEFPVHRQLIERFGRGAGAFLWYQGESSSAKEAGDYESRLAALVGKMREYSQNPDLRAYIVQIGALVHEPYFRDNPFGFGVIREAQRRFVLSDPAAFLVPALAGSLVERESVHPFPVVHLSTAGQRRLGEQLGELMAARPAPVWLGPKLLEAQADEEGRAALFFDRQVRLGGRSEPGRAADPAIDFHLRKRNSRIRYQARAVEAAGRRLRVSFPVPAQPGDRLDYGLRTNAVGSVSDVSDHSFPATADLLLREAPPSSATVSDIQ